MAELEGAADLKEVANRHGTTKAKCEECGGTVSVALLTEPVCPHCDRGFVGIEPTRRLFGSGTLVTGQPLALTAGDDPAPADRTGHGDVAVGSEGTQESESADAATELLEESKNV